MQPEKIQAELDKVVSALGISMRARANCSKKISASVRSTIGWRCMSKSNLADGTSTAITIGWASGCCGCRGNHHLDRRWQRKIGFSRHCRAPPGHSGKPACDRSQEGDSHQPPEHEQHKLRGLTDPHLWFAYQIGVLVTLAKNSVASSEVYVGGAVNPLYPLVLPASEGCGPGLILRRLSGSNRGYVTQSSR